MKTCSKNDLLVTKSYILKYVFFIAKLWHRRCSTSSGWFAPHVPVSTQQLYSHSLLMRKCNCELESGSKESFFFNPKVSLGSMLLSVSSHNLIFSMVFCFLFNFRYITSVAFSMDNVFLATGSADRTAKIWRLPGASTPTAAGDYVKRVCTSKEKTEIQIEKRMVLINTL